MKHALNDYDLTVKLHFSYTYLVERVNSML
jgi:hypothetical protein